MPGALDGLTIVEMGGIGPAPYAGMMLADHGATVIRIDRPGASGGLGDPKLEIVNRSRRFVSVNIKHSEGVRVVRDLCTSADGLIEGFRPGVMERVGLGPDVLLADNPRLVYGRMTGWGQDGPYAQMAGHDINYIALAGNLDTYGRAGERPMPPVNQIGDMGGGGMLLAFGMLAGILSARQSGKGQVIDCAMVDGAASLAAMTWMFRAQGAWRDERGTNILDTGAHFYETYECADGKHVALGSIEPHFYAEFLKRAGLEDDKAFGDQMNPEKWPALKLRLAAHLKTKPRDAWCAVMDGSDACFAPVLSMAEAPLHPHNRTRETFVAIDDVMQPAPAPRFAGTPAAQPAMPRAAQADTAAVLSALGYSEERLASLAASGAITVETA